MAQMNFNDDELFTSINKNIQTNFGFNSWASIVEEELGNSFEDIKLLGSTDSINKNTQNDYITDINKILKCNYKKMMDVDVLYYEKFVAGYLRQIFKKKLKQLNIADILSKLLWIQNVTQYLCDKIKLKIYNIDKNFIKNKKISMSSYKFCQHNFECNYNYGPEPTGCYLQHFVHNIVYVDIYLLINHIKDNDKINISEVEKCINTISYVINHMYEELKHIEFLHKGKSNELHKNHQLQKKRKKRK